MIENLHSWVDIYTEAAYLDLMEDDLRKSYQKYSPLENNREF